jgi:hypothetical protein
MGKYISSEFSSLNEKRRNACEIFNHVSTISFICHNLNAKMNLLPSIVTENASIEQLVLEQEIRMLLNILINVVLQIRNDQQLVRDFIDPAQGIEDMCFRSIKFSLEIAVVPIRKFLIVFYIYLKLLFGDAPGNFSFFK